MKIEDKINEMFLQLDNELVCIPFSIESQFCYILKQKIQNLFMEQNEIQQIEEIKKLVTDDQLNIVWGNANFGNISKREVIKKG